VFSTVTDSLADAVVPTIFVAMALMVCEPSVTPVLFHVVVYGDEVMAEPRLEPSTWNCTLESPKLSEADAESVTLDPETVAPFEGAIKEMTGVLVTVTVVLHVPVPALPVTVRV
jgi:hypothetical protein